MSESTIPHIEWYDKIGRQRAKLLGLGNTPRSFQEHGLKLSPTTAVLLQMAAVSLAAKRLQFSSKKACPLTSSGACAIQTF